MAIDKDLDGDLGNFDLDPLGDDEIGDIDDIDDIGDTDGIEHNRGGDSSHYDDDDYEYGNDVEEDEFYE
ncbi:hypothetical protein FACS189487_03840 [Campylobacterota bacterium]|nr:hypothetical protein FACS189487_03840 [Campylobacterota bacterium]